MRLTAKRVAKFGRDPFRDLRIIKFKATRDSHILSKFGELRPMNDRDMLAHLTNPRVFVVACVLGPFVVFTALHVMQTRYSDENSVCPSVRLSHA